MWVEMGDVSGEESIGFFTPAAGQLPWQQGQRVPTATADAVTEGDGLGPSVQASSPVCCVSTFAILLNPDSHLVFQVLKQALVVPVANLWAFHYPITQVLSPGFLSSLPFLVTETRGPALPLL